MVTPIITKDCVAILRSTQSLGDSSIILECVQTSKNSKYHSCSHILSITQIRTQVCQDCAMVKGNAANLVGIGPWRIVPHEPRHNTFHMELKRISSSEDINLTYLGLREMPEQEWMTQILPNSILRKYVAISPKKMKEISKMLTGKSSGYKTLYIFEGSISWFITLNILSIKSRNSTVICNFFSSEKYDQLLFSKGYKSLFFRSALRLVLRMTNKKAVVTFDTKLMSDKVRESLGLITEPFPVPSSFDFKVKDQMKTKHSRALINIRNFNPSKLHNYFESSCRECTFVIPKGLISSGLVSYDEFGKYGNIEFDESNIGEAEYAGYIDSFDYLIILYEPSINASGKILDAITRGVPVAVPREATEWAQISRTWGKSHLFRWGNPEDELELFRHPKFVDPSTSGEPPFTPKNSIIALAQISRRLEPKNGANPRFRSLGIDFISAIFYLTCTLLNYQYSTRMKLVGLARKRKIEGESK